MFVRHTILTASVAAAAALIAASHARADVPPPDGYVETCTVEKQTKPGTECLSCKAWHGDVDACEKNHANDGYRRSCRSSGASVWSEVWCRPTSGGAAEGTEPTSGEPVPPPASSEAEAEAAPVAEKKSGKCTGGGLPGALAWLGAIAGLPFLRRR